jgi:hypothetical protein
MLFFRACRARYLYPRVREGPCLGAQGSAPRCARARAPVPERPCLIARTPALGCPTPVPGCGKARAKVPNARALLLAGPCLGAQGPCLGAQ